MHTTMMTACVAWLVGIATEMDMYGAAVDRLRNTACVQIHKVKEARSSWYFPRLIIERITAKTNTNYYYGVHHKCSS